MMLKKPDLIDADTFRELDFFELAPEHFRMRRIFTRGRGDQIASRISHLPGSGDGVPASGSQLVYRPLRGVSSIAPRFLL
jgi:hypothetical protein